MTNPTPLPDFSATGPGGQRRRRPLRRPFANKSVGGGSVSDRRRAVVVERDVACGYSDAVGGLLGTSHGEAVETVAAIGNKRRVVRGEDFTVATSPTIACREFSTGWL